MSKYAINYQGVGNYFLLFFVVVPVDDRSSEIRTPSNFFGKFVGN